MNNPFPRLVIAGTNSGVGKSTIATGIMYSLSKKGFKVQGFKVGPDYIDPSYHSYATGCPSRNLDTYLLGKKGVLELYKRQNKNSQIAIIEGVMGLYDGKDGANEMGSTAEVAKTLKAPVVLVVDCRSMARSAAALIKGFAEYDPDLRLGGVILNQLGSDHHEAILREATGPLGIPVVGAIKRNSLPHFPSRHLGLIPAGEEDGQREVFEQLVEALEGSLDFDALLNIAKNVDEPEVKYPQQIFIPETKGLYPNLRIAYAKDKVFSFYYQDALDYLEHLGVSLIPFSPLNDNKLPENIDGLIIGGGFPELFLEELVGNKALLADLLNFAKEGKPIYAEAGGLVYLAEVGLIPVQVELAQRLQALGYYYGQIIRDSILGKANTNVKGHQFHYYLLRKNEEYEPALKLTKKGLEYIDEGYQRENIYGSCLHQHWAAERHLAQGFLETCQKIKLSKI